MQSKMLPKHNIIPADIKNGMPEKQINILSSAIDIFSKKGYQATTTAEIAKAAGVAEGTIFRYYKTKKDLLFAIPECLVKTSLTQVFLDDFSAVLNNKYGSFEDFIRALVLNRKTFASENITLIKVLFQEIAFHPELRDTIIQTILQPSMGKFIRAIDYFKEKGEIADIPSTMVTNLIFSSALGYFFSQCIIKPNLYCGDEKEVDYLVQYIMNGISKTIDS